MHTISAHSPQPATLATPGGTSEHAADTESATRDYLAASDALFSQHVTGSNAPCEKAVRSDLLPAQWAALEALAILANRREITARSAASSELPLPSAAQLGAYLQEQVSSKRSLRSSEAAFKNPLGSCAPDPACLAEALDTLRNQQSPLSRRLENIESMATSLQRNNALLETSSFLHKALDIARVEVLGAPAFENQSAAVKSTPPSEPLTGVRLVYAPTRRAQPRAN